MHVLLLDLGREWRGGQRQVLYLARRLAVANGYAVTVAVPRGAPLGLRAREEGLAVLELPGGREWNLASMMVLARALRGRGVRVIHTQCARSASLGALLKRLMPKLKLVHSRRVSYALGAGWSRKKYQLADKVAAVSGEIAQVLMACGVGAEKVRVIHSGIDMARYPRKQAGAGDAPLVLGMVGALTPQKGHEVYLRALAGLSSMADVPAWRARVVGDGPLLDDLRVLAGELGLAGRVAFDGYVDSAEAMPGFDILAVPSVDGEGSSGVIKEGWAVGLPVIASDLPSNLELVEHGANGWVFFNRDSAALALSLARLMRDPALRAELVRGGDARVSQFTDAAMAAAYMELYAAL